MKVLFATDGSRESREASRMLRRINWPKETRFIIAHAVAPLEFYGPYEAMGGEALARVLTTLHDDARELVEAEAKEFAGDVSTRILEGHAADAILNLAEEEDVDLIALGARGLGAVKRFFLGSVSSKIAKHAPCSVLIVHGSGLAEAEAPRPIERLLVGFDEGDAGRRTLKFLSELPFEPKPKVELVAVLEKIHTYRRDVLLDTQEILRELQVEARARLGAGVASYREAGFAETEGRFIESFKRPAEALMEVAEELGVDLVVVGSHRKGPMDRFLLGSTSAEVARGATKGVLVVRPKGKA